MFNKRIDYYENKTNFSAHLNTETEMKPFVELVKKSGLSRTAYFKLMLKKELKQKSVLKSVEFKKSKM